jgi:hypothetical protein
LNAREPSQASVAGAEIIKRGDKTELTICLCDTLDVLRVANGLVLGELEHDARTVESDGLRGFERCANTGRGLVIVDGCRVSYE